MQIFVTRQRLSAIRRRTDNADSRTLEHGARGVAKIRAVVNDQTAQIATRGNTHPSPSQTSAIIAFPLAGTPAARPRQGAFLAALTELPGTGNNRGAILC